MSNPLGVGSVVLCETMEEAENHVEWVEENGGTARIKEYDGEKCDYKVVETEEPDLEEKVYLPLG